MTKTRTPIRPSTRVSMLLRDYPQLEDTLIAMAPAFRKLKNPILRRSVAKVATLRHAAAVAQLPVDDLVNRLRAAAGEPLLRSPDSDDVVSEYTDPPAWFVESHVVARVDERDVDDRMPVTLVLAEAQKLSDGEMVELTTGFLPAPGIELLRRKGWRVWSRRDGPELVRTFFANAGTD